MGRKKIEIKYIDNKKERVVTFCKRKMGLLKKAAELATLCGVKVSLLFSDLMDNYHYYTNDPKVGVDLESVIKDKKKGDSILVNYKTSDYPFKSIKEEQKGPLQSIEPIRELKSSGLMLQKRGPQLKIDTNPSESTGKGRSTMSVTGDMIGHADDRERSFRISASCLSSSDSQISGTSELCLKGLDSKSARIVKEFVGDLDILSRKLASEKVPSINRDKDIVVTSLLSQLVACYFKSPIDDSPSLAGEKLRSAVSVQNIVSTIAALKLKEKTLDVSLSSMESFADNLLEIVTKPHSACKPIDLLVGPKGSSIMLYVQLKGYFQQIKTLRNLISRDPDTFQNSLIFSADLLKSLETVTSITVELFAKGYQQGRFFSPSYGIPEPMKTEQPKTLFIVEACQGVGLPDMRGHDLQLQESQPLLFSNYLEHHRDQDQHRSFDLSYKSEDERGPDIDAIMTQSFKGNSHVDRLQRRGISTNL